MSRTVMGTGASAHVGDPMGLPSAGKPPLGRGSEQTARSRAKPRRVWKCGAADAPSCRLEVRPTAAGSAGARPEPLPDQHGAEPCAAAPSELLPGDGGATGADRDSDHRRRSVPREQQEKQGATVTLSRLWGKGKASDAGLSPVLRAPCHRGGVCHLRQSERVHSRPRWAPGGALVSRRARGDSRSGRSPACIGLALSARRPKPVGSQVDSCLLRRLREA